MPTRKAHRQELFSHSLEYLSEPSSRDECNVYTVDSLLNGFADTIQKEISAKLSVQLPGRIGFIIGEGTF